jgi:hypothetical protein
LDGALTVLQASRHAASEAPRRVASHVGRTPVLSVDPEVAVVTTSSEVPLRILRRQVDWAAAIRSRQVWVFKRYARDQPVLTDALKTSALDGNPRQLLRTVDDAELGRWYEKVDARRRRGYQESVVAALEQEGLAPSAAIGVSRLGLVSKVRAAAALGADIQKVAALWMGVLKEIALARGTTVVELRVEPAHVAASLELLAQRHLTKDHLRVALEMAIDEGVSPAKYSDRVHLMPPTTAEMERIVAEVIEGQPDVVARAVRGDDKAQRFLAGLVMKAAKSPKPSYSEVVVALTAHLTDTSAPAGPEADQRWGQRLA